MKGSQFADNIRSAAFVQAGSYLAAHNERGKRFVLPSCNYRVYAVANALCSGYQYAGVAPVTAAGRIECLLEESEPHIGANHDARREDFLSGLSTLPTVRIDEASPLFPLWSEGFYHWMIECLPKVLLFEDMGYTGAYIVRTDKAFIMESLELLGIAPGRILPCNKSYIIKKVFLMEPLRSQEPAPLVMLRRRLLDVCGHENGKKNCFIKRIGRRRVLNEDELLHVLTDYELELLVPEELSLRDQIRFMSNSVLTLSPHGANSVLALFQKRNTTLLETFGRTYTNHCIIDVAKAADLLYIPLSEKSRYSMYDEIHISLETKKLDYTVDTYTLRAILDKLIRIRAFHT